MVFGQKVNLGKYQLFLGRKIRRIPSKKFWFFSSNLHYLKKLVCYMHALG